MWSKMVSQKMIPWDEALLFCRHHSFGGYEDWRLPSKTEIESIVNKALVDSNPDAKVTPLFGPFTEPSDGYMFSGTVVPGYTDAPWIMNLRNGHIFNGKGQDAYARCVRDMRFDRDK